MSHGNSKEVFCPGCRAECHDVSHMPFLTGWTFKFTCGTTMRYDGTRISKTERCLDRVRGTRKFPYVEQTLVAAVRRGFVG